ncbi:MAG: glycoside hydrolase family 2 TIM barrel-domain containing protein [Candidatus Ornithomonoglobus sp.]
MKRKAYAILAVMIVLQLLLSGIVTVNAEDNGIGEVYTAPESPAVTYNMNLDWKFFDAGRNGANLKADMWTVMAVADKDGKKFYDKDYDDSAWETVSIPHGIGGGTNTFTGANYDAGGGYRSVLLYRKTFTVPQYAEGGKVFFELEGIRQGAYVWCNGEKVGYYEAGIAPMGFDLTSFVKPGEEAVIAILDDGLTARGTYDRIPYETVPGEEWGSSYSTDNYKETYGTGAGYVWNTKDFNEPQIGLVYDAYLHVKGAVYQTLPLYNNLKTTGNYIYADNFDIKGKTATIHVDAEVRNESAADGNYTLEVAVVDMDGKLKYSFESAATAVKKASDAGVRWETAVESDVYDTAKVENPTGITGVNTPVVTYIRASYNAEDMRFWSTDDPYLYTVYTILKDSSGNVVDVQKKDTGFRKITYDANSGILINDKAVWMAGYAQRSTNEWAVIGVATDWLQDYDMALLKENNSNFIRWMHVAPKPNEVRSSDSYGVAVVVPAGDKEGVGLDGRNWSQRAEAMRDVMIYFRNSPSVVFWETGNSAVGSAANANDMARLRDSIDPHGMRFIGARSTTAADQMNYDYNYAGTMYGNYAENAINAMKANGILGPIMETEYARGESPRRVWDLYSPPDFDYVNKLVYKDGATGNKLDGYDVWNATQEEMTVSNVTEYNGYYANRAGYGKSLYSAAAMMVWSDSNMHTRNTATENCRTSGRVDAVRQKKEMFAGTKTAQSGESAIHIVGHWSYPQVSEDTYNYFGTENIAIDDRYSYDRYVLSDKRKRDPLKKTVYVIGSADVAKVELYRVDGETETLLGTDSSASSTFIYQFDNIDVTQGDAVIAKAYDARGMLAATDEIKRTYDAVTLRLTPHTAVKEDAEGNVSSDWRADGADIAYIDVEVIDKNGNVCALNYDRINFTYSGEGQYLGGYNSGSGANCLQNTAESEGISHYFGGDKSGTSTIGKDYVYAENGTNRIFVRSTRNAGTFTLNASMDGMLPVSVSINSDAVESTGGLTTVMSSRLSPDAKEAPVISNVKPLKPLMLNKKLIDWANVKTETEQDNTVYYDVYLNGTKLETSAETYVGTMDTLFGPIYEILTAAKNAGASGFTMVYDDSKAPAMLEVTCDGHTYQYQENRNQILIDNTEYNECVDMPVMKNGTMVANLPLMLGYAGVSYSYDNENRILNITVQ